MFGPVYTLAENLQTVSARIAEAGASAQVELRQFEQKLERTQHSWHDRLNRWRHSA